ncbi:uncharacterized protein [Chironomus tepperi]|uniref:uncharacterized protein n=1 Tax=Chironomus tepperi TaxID=113505 RepID=UPI00391EF97F
MLTNEIDGFMVLEKSANATLRIAPAKKISSASKKKDDNKKQFDFSNARTNLYDDRFFNFSGDNSKAPEQPKQSEISSSSKDNNLTSQQKPKPPPIHITSGGGQEIRRLMNQINNQPRSFMINVKKDKLKTKVVSTESWDDYDRFIKLLREKQHHFHTYANQEPQMKFVLYGLPMMEIVDLEKELKTENISPVKIVKMTMKQRRHENDDDQNYLLYFNKVQEGNILENLRKVNCVYGFKVKWAKYNNRRNGPSFCSKCLQFGHGQRGFIIVLSIFIISVYAESQRIAGGDNATLGQFPYHAKIEPSIGSFRRLCGGALIKYNWVITIAQCIFDARDVIVRLGVIDRLTGPETKIFWVRNREHIITHEDYSGDIVTNVFTNDIGLIFLEEATEAMLNIPGPNGNLLIGNVTLPPRDLDLDSFNRIGVVTGFGFYEDGPDALKSMILRYTLMMTIPLQECRDYHGTARVTGGNFCTKTTDGGSTCIGDEGGPFVILHNNIPTLIGLVSTTFQECTVGHPAIFTNTVSYHDWISGIIDDPPFATTVQPPTRPPGDDSNCNCICKCFTCSPEGILPADKEPIKNNFWDD